ncbi:MAG: hypothetical protein NTY35_11960 [Planctomycetota bacterium]|nr:hypothetical protein [Planctomycetota bacterium]
MNFPQTPSATARRARGTSASIAAGVLAFLPACTREVQVAGFAESPRIVGQRSRWTGEDTGTWAWSYPDGTARERGDLEDGHRVGTWSQWWSNGERRSEGRRVFDAKTASSPREGPWCFWHPNGAIAARGIYRHGEREGAWEYSLDDGRLDGNQSGIYHDDRKIADG